ncbi:4-hydroxybenzoyl-CoA thioesterase [Komagataeibacter rhaeticus]|uniref:YbgC/FadM family acyl-CoA thioesterase n=1 Tax=Komagataeibacter rhaeticus TaxID=215221 RepID=A0A181CDJ9_9PROT|nr:YbgC/FadM family acyl-CoA thioesterase [Komagataeibacter rhaeticus]ATU71694.1 4-hydroxybenzoyl-CoA thioesterase [Komagataeibacter xylinus]KDU96862.1 4-hydroxybenzoyl-CoA thioesterase [Komagataeibacter rhaeticus AF1]MBL7240603.1 YbgC/FadM family acyl-CoA thioesterase [Komagataeibacter rhaeticus]PYD53836.1 4-hydroxybenzoyl-CoA thioesterase [Komagataeibacter rhaeticus]QIP36231.1 YbgC/FadM family acyl-CoA thioesterase [Komagataeibacter rhaeticus]
MVEHKIDFRIYYEDTDAGGVVYHARYLGLAERARTEAIRAQGRSASDLLGEYGLAFVVRHAAIDYRAPLRLDDVVRITTRLTELGAASCRLWQDFHRVGNEGGPGCGTLDVRLACVRAADGRAARFPPPWRDLLRALVA